MMPINIEQTSVEQSENHEFISYPIDNNGHGYSYSLETTSQGGDDDECVKLFIGQVDKDSYFFYTFHSTLDSQAFR